MSYDDLFTVVAIAAVTLGTVFSALGVLGMYRFPDVYSRLHATGKVATFGVTILLIAAVILGVASIAKAFALLMFLLLAGPVLSHALSIAADEVGVPMSRRDATPPPPRE